MTRKVNLFQGRDYEEYNSRSEEYQRWKSLNASEMQAEIDKYVRQGINLFYDEVEDVFVIEETIFV